MWIFTEFSTWGVVVIFALGLGQYALERADEKAKAAAGAEAARRRHARVMREVEEARWREVEEEEARRRRLLEDY